MQLPNEIPDFLTDHVLKTGHTGYSVLDNGTIAYFTCHTCGAKGQGKAPEIERERGFPKELLN